QRRLAQPQPGGQKVGLLADDLAPLRPGQVVQALAMIDDREQVPALVAAQAGIDAGEVVTRRRREQFQAARLGLVPAAQVRQQLRLPKEQLTVAGTMTASLAEGGQCLV